jgi:hypothetical protein
LKCFYYLNSTIDTSLSFRIALLHFHFTIVVLFCLGLATKKFVIPSDPWQIVCMPPMPVFPSDSFPHLIVYLNLALEKLAIEAKLGQLQLDHLTGCNVNESKEKRNIQSELEGRA